MNENSLQTQQLNVVPYDEEEEKHRSYEEIHKELMSLKEIEKDVGELVGDQRECIKEVEQNTDKTHQESIEAGNELKKAAVTQAKGWKWMIGGGMMTIGGALGVIGGPVGIGIGSALGGALGAKIGSSFEKRQKKTIDNIKFN